MAVERRRRGAGDLRASTAWPCVEDNPYGLLGFSGQRLPGAALDGPRRDLPRLVLQDVRLRAAGRLGAGAAGRARPAGAGRRVGDAVPAELHPDAGVAVPGRPRLAQPDQDLHRGLPRAPGRDAARAGDLPAAGLHVERAGRRVLRVADRARGRRHQGDAAARGDRPGRLRVGHRLLRRRARQPAAAAVLLLPDAGADHRGGAPAGRGAGGGAGRDAHLRQPAPAAGARRPATARRPRARTPREPRRHRTGARASARDRSASDVAPPARTRRGEERG